MYPEQIQFWSSILTYDWSPLWKHVSPGSGAYLSESDVSHHFLLHLAITRFA